MKNTVDLTVNYREKTLTECLNKLPKDEIFLAQLVDFDLQAGPYVQLANFPEISAFKALSTVDLRQGMIGKQLAVKFTHSSPPQAIILGVMHAPISPVLDMVLANTTEASNIEPLELSKECDLQETKIDGKRILITGDEEIVLKCGDSSISLRRDGKIAIRGKYLLNRATGVNRILGGSVQVN
jgi:hypothetical protein